MRRLKCHVELQTWRYHYASYVLIYAFYSFLIPSLPLRYWWACRNQNIVVRPERDPKPAKMFVIAVYPLLKMRGVINEGNDRKHHKGMKVAIESYGGVKGFLWHTYGGMVLYKDPQESKSLSHLADHLKMPARFVHWVTQAQDVGPSAQTEVQIS